MIFTVCSKKYIQTSCNAKRRRERRRTVKKQHQVQLAKKQLYTCSTLFCTFLCRCFARLQRETSRNFLVTRCMEEMSYLFLFTFFSLRRSFSPCMHWWPLAFLTFSPPLQIYHVVLPTKKVSFVVYPWYSPYIHSELRPVSNVVLLPCYAGSTAARHQHDLVSDV